MIESEDVIKEVIIAVRFIIRHADCCIISMLYPIFIMIDDLLKLIIKRRLSKDFCEFIGQIATKYWL